jgi:hypothetical protein
MRILTISRLFMSTVLPMGIFIGTFLLQMRLGYDVSLFPLYIIPVAAFSYTMGLPGAIFSVLFATGLWFWGNILTGYQYDYAWVVYYNAGARGVVFAMVAVFVMMFNRVVEQHRQRMEAMRALLNVCHGCGSLQGSDGHWVPFEQLNVPKNRPICECPRCTAATAKPSPGGR